MNINFYRDEIMKPSNIITPKSSNVQLTKLLRRDILPLPTKNPQRDVNLPGNGLEIHQRTGLYIGANPILGYSHILSYLHAGNVSKLLFNLMADTNGSFLAGRELLYTAEEGMFMKHSISGYTSLERLETLKDEGIIKEYAEYSKRGAQAREAKLKTIMKGVSKVVIDFVAYILETNIYLLIREAHQAFLELTNPNREIFYHPDFTDRQNEIAQYTLDLMATPQKYKDQLLHYQNAINSYKEWQSLYGITPDLLVTMVAETIPGHQKARKDYIVSELIKRYNLTPPPGQSLPTPKPIKPIEPHDGLMVRALTIKPEEDTDHARCAIKHAAAQVLIHDLQPELQQVNQTIRENLQEYEDKDAIDTRQRAKMLSEISPLPLSYTDKSMTSPRIYSEEADNLFACRKDMRKVALKGLGAVDVDMKSCHTYILLAQWSSQLPLLKEAMEKGTLWDIYQDHYQKEGLPFHKKAVKAMHYASVLGGGANAFHQAIHRHNLDNPKEAITDSEELIKVHRKSPIYKELKGLLNYIEKEWHGKLLTLETGEKFKVKGIRRYKDKDTGELVTDYGNLLTVLSAYLQSKEVLMMSYLILRTRHLYTPILWQHDGLTIIPKTKGYLEKMQQVLDEATRKILGVETKIPLETFHM